MLTRTFLIGLSCVCFAVRGAETTGQEAVDSIDVRLELRKCKTTFFMISLLGGYTAGRG